MKTTKKHARKQLESFSTIFMQLGLVLALFVVFLVLEHKTVKETAIVQPSTDRVYEPIPTFQKPIIVKKLEQTKEVIKKNAVPKELLNPKVVDNKTDNTTVVDTPKNDIPLINLSNLPQAKEEEIIETSDDPVSINNVQKSPVFKGCEGLSELENRKCFERKIQQHIQRNFNADLAQDVGLSSGKYRISTQFVIDKTGKITDIQIRAPHYKLEKEANRVVHKIPQFQPGKQNNKEVKVKYTLPITFKVE
ncbi:energy transducer TonB [Tenacibaculum sp.]|uniref:energy transducer TonB n=1 Tax=Tenacibaculum sp. TaxID=1906242 RepID=UPI003D0D4E44